MNKFPTIYKPKCSHILIQKVADKINPYKNTLHFSLSAQNVYRLFNILMIFICLLLFEQNVYAESGTCGINVTWTQNGSELAFSRTDPSLYAEWDKVCHDKVYESGITKVEIKNTIVLPEGFKFNRLRDMQEMYLSNFDTSKVTDLSEMFVMSSMMTNLDVSKWNTSNVKSMYAAFAELNHLTSLDVSKWDTSNVTDMRVMFENIQSIKNLDLSQWNTSKVTDMSGMFGGVNESLTNLNLSGWNISNVISMTGMFYGCSSLEFLDVSNWDTSKVKNMRNMFFNCQALKNLDVSKWNTASVTDMSSLFYNCYSLFYLNVKNWDTSSVTNMDNMFLSCVTLTSLDFSNWDTSNVTKMKDVFKNCKNIINLVLGKNSVNVNIYQSLPNYDLSWYYISIGEDAYENHLPIGTQLSNRGLFTSYNPSTMAGTWSTQKSDVPVAVNTCGKNVAYTIDGSTISFSKMDSALSAEWNSDCHGKIYEDGIMKIYINDTIILRNGFKFEGLINMKEMNLSKFDTSYVTDMRGMFLNCTSLINLDVSGWNTSNVVNMDGVFQNCSSLITLDVSQWNTSNVTNMFGMFTQCKSLENLDLNRWNTSNVTEMQFMFSSCYSLTNLEISKWNTSNVTDMGAMFLNCYSLKNLDVSEWNVSKVSFMGALFEGCSSLTDLNLRKWNTSNATNMRIMFAGCSSLISLDLRKWNTSKVTEMWSMFENCNSLTSLDISGWDTSNINDMKDMFKNCNNLKTISLGKNTINTNIFETLPKYSDIWYYVEQGEAASDPLEIGSTKSDGTLFTEYDYRQMAGTWSVDSQGGYVIVTFDANGGEGELESQRIPMNVPTALRINDNISREGYSFRGWNTNPDGNGDFYADGEKITLSSNITLYAQWKLIDVEVKLDAVIKNINQDGGKGAPNDLKDEDLLSFIVVLKKGKESYSSERFSIELKALEGLYEYPFALTFTDELPELTSDFVVELKGLPSYILGYEEPIYGVEQETHKYYLSGKAWINKDEKIEIQLIWTDERATNYHPEPGWFVPLPEDEIGAYALRDDGTKEYLIFQTYDICMLYLGSDDLCRGNERCYHK